MRLVHCYIENFGGLSRFSMDFDPGLNVIRQPNGFGKTTLAEFIRAMFYGFPRKAPKQLSKREKYRPWNGQTYGGHLTYEHGGRQYRIERTFGATPRQDTVCLIDLQTGQKTTRFSEEIGLPLFGLDAESFERSTYLPQNRELSSLNTDSIRAKLSNLVEDTGDVGNFEKAVNTLRGKRSAYIPYRGTGGTVAQAQAGITRVQARFEAALNSAHKRKDVARELEVLEMERLRTADEIETVRKDLTAANEAAARWAYHQQYDQLTAALERTKGELEELKDRYPHGFPGPEELEQVSDAVERKARLTASSPVTDEDRRAQRFAQAHQAHFTGGVPEAAQFDDMRRIWDGRRVAETRLEACALPAGEAAELQALEDFFAPGIPREEDLRRYEQELEQAARLRQENLRLAARTVEIVPCKVPSPMTVPLLLGCGGGAVLVGILQLVSRNRIPGIVLLVLGALALAAGGYVNLRRTMTRQVPGFSPQIQTLIRENEEQAARLEAAARAFGGTYGQCAPAEIRSRMARLEALSGRRDAAAKKQWELTALVAEYDAALDGFFETYRYRPEGDAYEGLNRFQRICENWERAQRVLADRDERIALHRGEAEKVRAVMEAFCEKYAQATQTRSRVLAIRDDIRRAAELRDTAAELEGRIARYRQEHADALAESPVGTGEDPQSLRRREEALLEKQNAIGDRLLRLRREEQQLQDHAQQLPELEEELARLCEQKEEGQRCAAVLDDTIDFLTKARDELATSYMGPIRERFADLMSAMAGESPEKILVTPELEVRLERGGASRELSCFSAGQTDLVMLCMRLALVDALFRSARPFVILDDPFVNLDDAHTREAMELLRQLSRDRQILYLVCNSSRV